ncbi:MAG: glutamine-hydrolyzing GMP synthase [Verrucomicrobiae bacterium]|nr:glutamine-hydrolyzing GMP synthase [Verrucomicrobiae bacterium]
MSNPLRLQTVVDLVQPQSAKPRRRRSRTGAGNGGRAKPEQIIILDFGSQYTQVIARRVRECEVFSQILRFDTPAVKLAALRPRGLILSGGPASVYAKAAPLPDSEIWRLGVPVLGICYGMQALAHQLGGKVEPSAKREYGHAEIEIVKTTGLFDGMESRQKVWMSHGDRVTQLPAGFEVLASSSNSPYAAIGDTRRQLYGLQFHPEVHHTPNGRQILENFVHRICGCGRGWTPRSFVEQAIEEIRERVGAERVILGLSGGVDSSVAAALIHRAIGDQLTCVFVNNGLLRKGEAEGVQRVFGQNLHIRLHYEDASEIFLRRLKGVTDPERKRKIIGRTFIEVFEKATRKAGHARFLAQGTTYPDVIESVPIGGNPAALIKSHHNVGGLPKRMKFELLEPLRSLFKDEVRRVGEELGLPREIVWRQPFPGPGLAVRILGEVTPERLAIVREADWIVIDEMKKADLYYKVWQTFAVLLPVKTVGVMGDERTYDNVIAIRAVESVDGMTADWVRLPYELMQRLASRIINEVKGVNRVCYDISSKPPSTIEWE